MTWGTISGGPINFFNWSMAYPYNYSTNYGGQYQYNLMPSFLSPNQAFDIQNMFNPFYNIAQMMNRFYCSINPFQSMQQAMLQQAASAQGYDIGMNIGLNVAIQNVTSNISTLKSQISKALESDKLNDKQKVELKAILKEIETLERRVESLAHLRNQGASTQQIQTEVDSISKELNKLTEKAKELAKKISADLVKVETKPEVEDGTPVEGDTPGDNEEITTLSVPNDAEVIDICVNINDAVKGLGTDDSKLEAAMKMIDANNVIEVFTKWDETYGNYKPYKADKDGLIETLMDDCEGKEKEKIGNYIVNALETRARALGLNLDKEIAEARLALKGNWIGWHNDDKIQDSINNIVAKIIAKELENK